MTPESTWVDVIIDLIPLLAAVIVLVGVALTVRQKARNDRKEQWWKRVQWAADAVASDDERRRCVGMSALIALISASHAIEHDDAGLLQAIISQVSLVSFADQSGGGASK
ncbi:hypothetical protein [Phytohabitans rumicis]|uniref:hypothetical protein n=1 Tax=Phytohabitans rumicis TaxID=1076125 RepID=UPI0015679DA2|nr:hypothetical protein [Phytohabitans rumicis]